jgi:hypothetical protein
MAKRASVRTHTVTRNGKTYTRKAHTRSTPGGRFHMMKLRPSRAWSHTKKAGRAIKQKRRAAAVVFGVAALTEITAFTVFKGVGGALAVAGVGMAALGAAMWKA